MFSTIKRKTIFLIISTVSTVFFLFSLLIYNSLKNYTFNFLEQTNNSMNKLLNNNIKEYIYNNDIKSIKIFIDSVQNPFIKSISIYNMENEILVSHSVERYNKDLLKKLKKSKIIKNESYYLQYSEFNLLDEPIAYMVVEGNLEHYKKEFMKNFTNLLLTLSAIFVVVLFIGYFIARSINKPLENILKALQNSNKDEKLYLKEQKQEEFVFLTKEIMNKHNSLYLAKKNIEETLKKEIELKKQLSRQHQTIIQQTKMAALGEMIGNIAHQWRQPLSVISTAASGMVIQKEFGALSDEMLKKTCESINENAQFLSTTIDDFRDFIKRDTKSVDFNLSQHVKSFLNLINSSLKQYDINIEINLDNSIEMYGHPGELTQCFMNIFGNTKDAFKEKNIDKYLFISTCLKEEQVVITFKDNAGGIPEDIIPKVFEPYFTTKHESIGTGLGLHMTYNLIVEGMNGNIEVNNVTYEHNGIKYVGALFTITLPIQCK